MPNKPNINTPGSGPKRPLKSPEAPKIGPGLGGVAEEEVFEDDFTDVESGFELVSEGFHHAKVIDFEKSDSKAGNPQYVWQFRVIDGESKDLELRYWTSLLPQARWKVVEALEAIGIAAEGSIARFKRSDIIGKPCIVEVIHEDYDGRATNKVAKIHPPDSDTEALALQSDKPF